MSLNTIKNWSEDDRPREKLINKGPNALSNAELLAILINNGTRNKSAVDLSKELMQAVNNNLQRLGQLTVKEIVQLKIKGLGEAKAIAIAAALEIGIRRSLNESKKSIIQSSSDIAAYLKDQLQYKNHEIFLAIFLNQSNKIIHQETLSEGGITGSSMPTRLRSRRSPK